MSKEFRQIEWDAAVADDCRQIVRLAVREDLDRLHDWTTVALVPQSARDRAAIVSRQAGVIAGLPAADLAIQEMHAQLQWSPAVHDGDRVQPGQTVAVVEGSTRDILTTERIVLNLLGRLSGIATLTRAFVDAVGNYRASVYDTRKTTPGWRRLEKYAVRCGGGHNHRTGLFDAILIKDNHLASGHRHAVAVPGAEFGPAANFTPAEAVRRAKLFVQQNVPRGELQQMIVEVEVDGLDQLAEVLPAEPDIVLLDNMSPDQLREAVQMRDAAGSATQLEASGGVRLETVVSIAATGVERISAGALTHSAVALDLGLDWDQP